MDEMLGQLARPIKDLEDVRLAMVALESVRHRQLDIDATLGPIEVRLSIILSLLLPCCLGCVTEEREREREREFIRQTNITYGITQ